MNCPAYSIYSRVPNHIGFFYVIADASGRATRPQRTTHSLDKHYIHDIVFFQQKTLQLWNFCIKLNIMPRQIIKFGQVSENRKARFAYSIDDTIEAGISLTGAEIKSLRYGLVTIVDGFVQKRGDNLFLAGVEIQKLPTANRAVNFDERRQRQLLLHRNQINRLIGKLQEKGATIVPLKLYFNNRGKLKVLLGIGYGKNKVDKRETIKQREWERSKSRLLKK